MVENYLKLVTKTYSMAENTVENVQDITLRFFREEIVPELEKASFGRLVYRSEENGGLGYYVDSDTAYSNIAFMFDLYNSDGSLNNDYDIVLFKNRHNSTNVNANGNLRLHAKNTGPFVAISNADSQGNAQIINATISGNDTTGRMVECSSWIQGYKQNEMVMAYPPMSTRYSYDTKRPHLFGFGRIKYLDNTEEDCLIACSNGNVNGTHIRPYNMIDYTLPNLNLQFNSPNNVAIQRVYLSGNTGYIGVLKDFYYIYNNLWNTQNDGYEAGTTGKRIQVGTDIYFQIANRLWVKES